MFEVQGLDVDIGPTPILRGIALEVPSGTTCGLIGRNGAGKTTFMRAIMGALKAKAGSITFDDTDLVAAKPHDRAHMGIGFMPEDRRLVPQTFCCRRGRPRWTASRSDCAGSTT